MSTIDTQPEVFLVDDDPSIRKALSRGLAAEGFTVRTWDDPLTFLQEHDPATPGCLVADIAMPRLTGLELQDLLSASGRIRPIVFITGKGSIPMTVQAMRAGAVTLLPKPVHLQELVAAVREAIERDARARKIRAHRAAVERRLMALTVREREVLELVVAGRMNKQIAARLGVAEKTIKVHRGRVMLKMKVRSLAELVKLSSQAGLHGDGADDGGWDERPLFCGPTSSPTGPMQHARPLIAVVDDEESVRRALVRLLHASQLDVEAFASGQAFLSSLAARRPDCLVLDFQMPGLTGRDVQRQLAISGVRLPVIIMTAYDEPMMRERCLADGAAAYLCKPLRGDTLLNTIENALGCRLSNGAQ